MSATNQAVDQALLDQQLLHAARDNIALFARAMFPSLTRLATPAFHHEILGLLADRTIRKKSILAPRGHGKSIQTSFFLPTHRIGFNHRDPRSGIYEPYFIIIVSETQGQSANFLANIRATLKYDPLFRYYFGDLMKGTMVRDTDIDIVTNNACRVLAMGTGQKVRGQQFMGHRPHLVILDDFESEFNTLTTENRKRNKQWVAGAVEPSLDRHRGEIAAIGTLIHADAFLQDVKNDPSWKSLFYQAELDASTKTALWPEMMSWADLMKEKASYQARGMAHVYYREYMNRPTNPEEQHYAEEDFCYWDGDVRMGDAGPELHIIWEYRDGQSWHHEVAKKRPVDITVGVDPNAALYGDYGAILPLCVTPVNHKYVDDYVHRRMDSFETIEEMFQMGYKYHPRLVVVETVAYQQTLEREFKRRQLEEDYYIPVRGHKPPPGSGPEERKGGKRRHQEMIPSHRRHELFIKKGQTALEQEMRDYPMPAHDDLLDALWLAHTFCMPAEKPVQVGGETVRPWQGRDKRRPGMKDNLIPRGNWKRW